ncbi:hypothetical protein VTP01DRAFT_1508 [Rhizomucor pusillus]|uniref:uncharacterized protein n=1 Tax=Rhizomucor pusillus TaxID=4840 RepID=UPI0037441DA1
MDRRGQKRSSPSERSPSPERPRVKPKPISAKKLQAFTMGTYRKSAFQRHKEEAEQKKKQESEEAAKVYAEIIASFEEPTEYRLGTSSFVKSGTLNPTAGEQPAPKSDYARSNQPSASRPTSSISSPPPRPSAHIFTTSSKPPAPKPNYKPMPFVKAGEAALPKSQPKLRKLQNRMQDDEDDDEDDALAMKEAKAQKKRNLDTFLQEIKKEQEDREDRLRMRQQAQAQAQTTSAYTDSVPSARDAYRTPSAPASTFHENSVGSFDVGDPTTTNLYVGNISPSVNEIMLCQEFAKYGPIASVKIMWPRTQEEMDRKRNCGFVSFMTRSDAEQALNNLDGYVFHGHEMKVGWSKAVPLPPKPVFVLEKSKPASTGLPFNAVVVDKGGMSKPRAEVRVVKPHNMQQVKIIHRLVERVARHGPDFEAVIMDREKGNPKFQFLFDNKSEEHIYYRWRLYSILQGDTRSQWRTEPFQMFEGGAWWIPPEVPFDDEGMNDVLLDTDDEEKEKARGIVPKGVLGKVAKQRFEIMVRQVTFQRGTIARAMEFAIDHADAADEVIDILIRSLLLPETSLATKLARLYLVSDILHNSGAHVANAWKYRVGLENQLPAVFEHFNAIYRSITARLKAEQVRRHICNVLSAWENWMVFPKHHIDNLTEIFVRKDAMPSEEDAHEERSIPGNPAEQGKEETPEQEKVPSEPLDGELIEDVDGEPMEDLDGEPMEDLDGEPMEDLDGEPMEDEQQDSEVKPEQIEDMFA